jgi:uncharacterized protein YdhG (YjbR/CyaY superfamily)
VTGVTGVIEKDVVGAYVAAQPEPQRAHLAALADLLRTLLPRAEEAIAYGMPAWKVDGIGVAGFVCAKGHWAYAPFSGSVTSTLVDELRGFEVTKGTVKVAPDADLPKALVKKLVAARLAEIAMVPDSKGVARDIYADGGLKAKGRMKDGELHGDWQWWRKDGSLQRSGRFDRGRQVGEWTTYDRDGRVVKVTDLGR